MLYSVWLNALGLQRCPLTVLILWHRYPMLWVNGTFFFVTIQALNTLIVGTVRMPWGRVGSRAATWRTVCSPCIHLHTYKRTHKQPCEWMPLRVWVYVACMRARVRGLFLAFLLARALVRRACLRPCTHVRTTSVRARTRRTHSAKCSVAAPPPPTSDIACSYCSKYFLAMRASSSRRDSRKPLVDKKTHGVAWINPASFTLTSSHFS